MLWPPFLFFVHVWLYRWNMTCVRSSNFIFFMISLDLSYFSNVLIFFYLIYLPSALRHDITNNRMTDRWPDRVPTDSVSAGYLQQITLVTWYKIVAVAYSYRNSSWYSYEIIIETLLWPTYSYGICLPFEPVPRTEPARGRLIFLFSEHEESATSRGSAIFHPIFWGIPWGRGWQYEMCKLEP